MHKLLIPLFVCLTATIVHAQVPRNISISSKIVSNPKSSDLPDAACNAGTFTVGPFAGQSNDIVPDTIFLCFGDSLFINHNGDQVFMDPDPSTTPGIGYAFYKCPPTATGDLPTILADPCVWPQAANGLWVATANNNPDGDLWFINTGSLINSPIFGKGNPVQIFYAPITLDDYAIQGFEGGCVDVNVSKAFSVVYLKAITESGIETNFNDDCKGKFRLRGGYPEWDANANYTVTITLDTDPNVKALIYTPPTQMRHGNDVIFSVSQSGTYNVTVEDGKSCGLTFQVNMSACTPANNVALSMPELVSPPGSQICVPLYAQNFASIIGTSFSIAWDPTVLQYNNITAINQVLQPLGVASNLNEINVSQGSLGFVFSDFVGTGATVANGATLFEICFTIVGPLGSCTPLDISSFPSLITMDDALGGQLAVTADTGQVCADIIPLAASFSVDKPTCQSTASAAAIILGGVGPYYVSWESLPSGTPNGYVVATLPDTILTPPLTEGTWRVCVTDDDNNGTKICDTLTVDIPTLGLTLGVLQQPTCFGLSDGSLEAQVSLDGVTLPAPVGTNYTFFWPGRTETTQQIYDVAAGNYTVVVTDNNTGCTQLASGTLSQPAPISVTNLQITQASCPGVADGCLAVNTVSGGTPFPNGEYFFAWEYSPNASGTPLFTDDSGSGTTWNACGKQAGYYFLTVTDGNGCTQTAEAQITNLRTLSIDPVKITDPSCTGLSNGSIEVDVNAQPAFNNPTYLFFWNSIPTGGPYQQTNNGNNCQLTGLPGNRTYFVLALETVTGCSDTASFVVKDPLPVSVSATMVNPTCQQPNGGSITATATGGAGNFVYTWASNPTVPIPPGPKPTGLAAGTYTVTATDANGCTAVTTVQLKLPPPPPITKIDSVSVKCGADGSLTVTAPTAVSFTWTNLSGTNVGNTAQVTGLPGDTYIVTVRDAQNCVNSDTVTLGSVTPIYFADTLLTQPTCAGDANGSIALDVKGGKPGYVYKWASGQNTPVIFPIKAGTYTVTVTDLNGCTLVGTFALKNPPPLGLQFNGITPASCPGVCDGKVTLVAYYNSVPPTNVNLNFLWEDGSTDSVRVDLCAGWNTVTITDPAKGCFRIDSVSIDSPVPMVAQFDTVSTTCFGDDDGQASVKITGGTAGATFSYKWSSGSTLAKVTNLAAGQYTLTVTDNISGCTQVFVTDVPQPDEVIVSPDLANSENIACYGGDNGVLAVTASGGNPGIFTFAWSDASNNPIGTGNPLEHLSSGAYNVTATDSKGCTGTLLNLPLFDPPPVQGVIEDWEPLPCHGDETALVIDTIFGGSGAPYQYSLDYGVYLDPNFSVPMGGGEHFVTFIDRAGCEYTDTITVIEPDPFTATFDSLSVTIKLGDSIQLVPIITGSIADMFTWTPAELLSDPTTLEPFTRTYASTLYTISVTDPNGCTATASITVKIDPDRNVYIPNAFIPGNPRGLNDHFNPNVGVGVDLVNYMRVFDRWGNLMYERNSFFPNNNDFTEGWDGRYRGDYVSPGVYVYAIEVRFKDKRVLLYRGDVTVLR